MVLMRTGEQAAVQQNPLANSSDLVNDTQAVLEKTTRYSMGLIEELDPPIYV